MALVMTTRLFALTVASALLLATLPQDSLAQEQKSKTCRKLGQPPGCVVNEDVKRKDLTAEHFDTPAGADFAFKIIPAEDVGFLGTVYATTTVEVPGAGVVVVQASAYLFADENERGTVVCFFTEGSNGLVLSNTSQFFGTVNAFRPPPGLPGEGEQVDLFYDYMSIVRGIQVTGTKPVKIALVCKMRNTATARGPLGLGAPTITAQYFSTQYCVRKKKTTQCR